MTSRLGERTLGVLAGSCVVILVMLIVLLWTGVGTGMFNQDSARRSYARTNRTQQEASRIQDITRTTLQEMVDRGNNATGTPVNSSGKKAVQLSISEDSTGREVEYVKPIKIPSSLLHEDDKLYGPDLWAVDQNSTEGNAPPMRHHSGHFRHKMAPVWDPHPQYQFTAFEHKFHLYLTHDSAFVAPDLQVTHVWHNQTIKEHPGLEPGGCFYSGKLVGDPQSSVAVSLCHGMTGYIFSSLGNFFIEPAEQWRDSMSPILHAVYRGDDTRLQTRGRHAQDTGDTGVPHCGVGDGVDETSDASASRRVKRSFNQEQLLEMRNRRKLMSGNNQYNIEIMVVADKKMEEYHKSGLTHYILSLMHTVNKFYKHATVGNPISIAVVKIMVLKDMESQHSTKRKDGVLAPEYLRKFCAKQAKDNVVDDTDAEHYDTALLLTRENLCRSIDMPKCDTLGLAEMGTVCSKHSSCSIVRDNGLSAAFTIAHELGHVLNMPHDDEEKCRAYHSSSSKMNNVMSRMLDNNTSPYSWSNCSRHYLTEFLEAGNGDCLLDLPFRNEVEKMVPRDWLPGENFTEDLQCELGHGNGAKICSYMPVCDKLWCETIIDGRPGCKTNHMPWADGTSCGRQKWCQQGECVHRDRSRLEPVNGGWGPWQEFGECSRTCGGGVKRGVRHCDSPRNLNGGQYCLGQKIRYRSCNTDDCPQGSKDFREVQCSAYDGNNFKIQGLPSQVTWVPKYGGFDAKERCVLYCRVALSSDYYPLALQVVDGTKCGPDTYDMCVNGICRPAGCNHVLHTDSKLDFCGKCGGDNSTCHWMNGSYNHAVYGYNEVVRIPAGSSNIDIRQAGHLGLKDDNYIALSDGVTGEYLLNGKYSVTNWMKTIQYAGAKLQYSGSDAGVERLNSSAPIGRDLVVEVLSVGKMDPPNIHYKYTTMFKEHRWVVQDDWTECDKVCHGERRQALKCVRVQDGREVQPHFCNNIEKPEVGTESCNIYCSLKWHVWSRSECSSHCGPGTRTLSLQCVQETYPDQRRSPVQESHCAHILHLKPSEQERCEGPCDEAHWMYGDWGQCSATCGGGKMSRTVTCVDDLEREVDSRLCDASALLLEKQCARNHCPQWVTDHTWTPCSKSCGAGEMSRAYYCQLNSIVVSPQSCHSQPVPEHRKPCHEGPCQTTTQLANTTPATVHRDLDNTITHGDELNDNSIDSRPTGVTANWRTGTWGECSRSCGGGVQRRLVVCQGDAPCKAERPTETVHCNQAACPSWKYGMWGECNSSCDLGYRHRQVGCLGSDGKMLSDESCAAVDREPHYEECSLPSCTPQLHDRKRWRIEPWGPCSRSCGSGERRRVVECPASPAGHCEPRVRPRQVRPCKNAPCPNSWVASDWTECSVTCGSGVQRRTVMCNALTTGHHDVQPETCHGERMPTLRQTCHQPACDSHFYWRAGEWQQCSHACGKKGRQIRTISCYHRSDKKVPRYNCPDESKPKRKRKCNQRKCTSEFSSCLDVQLKTKSTVDREYQLWIDGRGVSIFCHAMSTAAPREFLTLPPGSENFAEIYDKRLLKPDSCPDSGRRRDNCACVRDAEGKAGLTEYQRIRLNITSLRVNTQDVTYAHQTKGTKVAYAESGDCYSRSDCPQGRFSVDLRGTLFRVSHLTQWEGHGSKPSKDIRRLENDQHILGKCGGYCGTCSPRSLHGLTLDWLQPP